VIEADGGQHGQQVNYDAQRTAAFAREGFRTLRFWNNDILGNLDGVLLTISEALPSPSHRLRRRAPPSRLQGEGL
jgi:very-short-patch-repair endonuclease